MYSVKEKVMSDFSDISRLQEEQEKTLQNCITMIEKWEKFKEDYEAVDKLLNDLPHKTTHDIMVPIGPLAFMPGQLIHTNEIMVLLGDHWFAERSASQAVVIAKRRLGIVEEYLSNLHKEHENILSHMFFTSDILNPTTQNDVEEIREELPEKYKQSQGRVAHAKATKHSVKKVDLRNHSSSKQTKSKEDENLFARLEELERQEQLNKELENKQYFKNSSTCQDGSTQAQNGSTENATYNKTTTSLSNASACNSGERARNPGTVPVKDNSLRAANDRSTQSEKNDVGDACSIVENSNDLHKRRLVKKVSWKESIVEEKEEDKVVCPKDKNSTIYFTHSSAKAGQEETQSHEKRQNITSPADIFTHYFKKNTEQQHCQLKNSADEQSSMSKLQQPEGNVAEKQDHNTKEEIVPQPQIFSDVVVEHKDIPNTSASIEKDKQQKPETRKMSKFKAGRMKNL